jgi:TRAP-type mannitol/chloroaromatic compound transport system permease large subunit
MLLVFCAFIVLILIGMPVAFSIGISGALFFLQHLELPFTVPIQLTVSQTQNFALLAVPLFILSGNFMNQTGITRGFSRFPRC